MSTRPRATVVVARQAGLVVTAHGVIAASGRLPGEPGLPPPDPGAVPEVARWIAPEFLPVRFDARFFVVAADRGWIRIRTGSRSTRPGGPAPGSSWTADGPVTSS
jgi:hypothetical protein